MAHGMFKIKVTKTTNNEVMYEYAACACPRKGEAIRIDGMYLPVVHIIHHMQSGQDGGGEYHSLDYVEIQVAK